MMIAELIKKSLLKKHLLSVLLLLMVSVVSAIAQPQISVSVDTNKILIGDLIKLQLAVSNVDKSSQVIWPVTQDIFKQLEIIDEQKIDTSTKGAIMNLHKSLIISAYDSGTFTIPELKFLIINGQQIDTLISNPIAIQVRTLDVDTTKDYMPLKANLDAPIYWYELWYVWVIIVGVVVLIIVVYLVTKQFKKSRNKIPQSKISLFDATIGQLQALKKKDLPSQGSYKQYYSELSEIVKTYIDQRFQLQSLEQTTAEVLQISKRTPLLKKNRTELKLILRTADLVKFAKAQPNEQQLQEAMEAAFRLVNQTKQREEEVQHVG